MKRELLYFTFFLLMCLTLPMPATAQVVSIPEPVPPPSTVREAFELDPFYQQWIDVEGLPVVASAKVNPYALKEAAWLLRRMIGHRPDVLQAIVEKKVRFTVIGYSEMTTDIPEYSHLRPAFYWDRRVRGLGASGLPVPAVSCTEENLLDYPGDTAATAYQLIHEFSHVVHKFGLRAIDPTFDNRLKIAYDAAMEQGLWQGTYSSRDKGEYWAQGAWYYFNGRTNGNRSQAARTWEELQNYDPALAVLLIEIYGDSEWVYTPIETRTNLPHLQGFNPQDSPAFEWPQELEEAYAQLKDPNINGGDEWVNLDLYDPSLASQFSTPETLGNRTLVIFANLLAFDVLVYHLQSKGRENLMKRFPANLWHLQTFSPHAGDIFIIRTVNGNPLAVFQAVEITGRVLIGPATVVITHGLSKVSGDNQSSLSGATLAAPFVVELRDENGSVLEGISVTFTVVTGDGTLSVTHTTTDADGQAESRFTLGASLGINTVSVSAVGGGQPVVFNAVAEAAINIPDPNLRAVIEGALSKVTGDPITASEMATLTRLEASEAGIRNLTGLEHATHLMELFLNGNAISDLSPLAGLTNLTLLKLNHNSISEISSLANLTNLRHLVLYINKISDPSPVAGLTELTYLNLAENLISDISAVVNLTNLTHLELPFNSISDLSPLVANPGLGSGDELDVRGNPLSYLSIHTHIPTLQNRGVTVEFDNQAHPALLKISGDNQNGASSAPLSQPFIVEAQDGNGSALAGVSVRFAVTAGGGTLSTTITRTDENGRAQSTLTLGPNLGTNTVEVSAAGIESPVTFHAISDTESPPIEADINNDSSVNILDLILIASDLGNTGTNLAADVNGDGVVSILDLVLVAGMFDGAAAAPSAQPQVPETLTAVKVQGWLTDARTLEVRDLIMKRGFVVLEQLLVSLTPRETELLANYPNPFNPETWIPYRLAEDAFVTLTIYDLSGRIVRTLNVGHRIASAYENRSKAIYWDGRNGLGERVASGVYFYHLSTGEYSATRRMVILK